MVVVIDVIMQARRERIKAGWCCQTEVLGVQGAKGALNRRVVLAVVFTAHALLDSTLRKHRPIGLDLVVPALVRVNDQFRCASGPAKRYPQLAGNQPEEGMPSHLVRNVLVVVEIHPGR